jgi:hypothetical protein
LFIANYHKLKGFLLLALAFFSLQSITVLAASDETLANGVRFRVSDVTLSRVRVSDMLGANNRNQQRAQVSGNSSLGLRSISDLSGGVDVQIGSFLSNDPFDATVDNPTRFRKGTLWRAIIGNGEWDPTNAGWAETSTTVINGGAAIIMTHQDGASSGTISVTPTLVDGVTLYRNNGDPRLIRKGLTFVLDVSNAKKNGIYTVNSNSIVVEVTADFL